MKYQISGQELEKVLELVSKVMNPLKKAESVLDRPSDEDLLFYDNVSMMDKLRSLKEPCNAAEKTVK